MSDMDMGGIDGSVDYMTVVPDGGVPEEEKTPVPRVIYEGSEEVKLDGSEKRPAGTGGRGDDPDYKYFWKMSKDKRTIDVVFPIESWVRSEDIIYRWGEDPMERNRGPPLQLGYRKRNEAGRMREHLVVDGQVLNAVKRDDSMWVIEEISGVRCVVLTLTRPSMMRWRHDPILKRRVEEERIEPQTWDALVVEERLKPEITKKVYFNLMLGGRPAGRMVFGVYGNVVPKTVENFLGLVTGEYEDENGDMVESAHCLKGSTFSQVKSEHVCRLGCPGLHLVTLEFNHEELVEYAEFFKTMQMHEARSIGKVERDWTIRWGADLGLPYDEEGEPRKPGESVDGTNESSLQIINETLAELVEKGEGAKLIFHRPEFTKGIDVKGGKFPAENYQVAHSKRGLLSMDRNEDKDEQGSCFFITLAEFPQMDKRWVVFGEMLKGEDLLRIIEDEWEGRPDEVVIEDCGILEEA